MKLFLITALSAAALFGAVDINSASIEQLKSVKGIGEKRARQIVAFRKSHCFQSVNDLTKIKGIGQKSIEKLEPHLKAGPCKN